MVTFDQRSANSFISRAIINRANHMDSPLILTQENVAGNKERWKKKGRARGPEGRLGDGMAAMSLSTRSFPQH